MKESNSFLKKCYRATLAALLSGGPWAPSPPRGERGDSIPAAADAPVTSAMGLHNIVSHINDSMNWQFPNGWTDSYKPIFWTVPIETKIFRLIAQLHPIPSVFTINQCLQMFNSSHYRVCTRCMEPTSHRLEKGQRLTTASAMNSISSSVIIQVCVSHFLIQPTHFHITNTSS